MKSAEDGVMVRCPGGERCLQGRAGDDENEDKKKEDKKKEDKKEGDKKKEDKKEEDKKKEDKKKEEKWYVGLRSGSVEE
jgi:hypothetical protein